MQFDDKALSAYKGDRPFIFLSYSHKDKADAEQITRSLINRGFRVWYDEGLTPATEWDETVAIRVETCSFFIALISRNYLASENCRDELNFARDRKRQRLLIYLEDVELPSGMAMRLMRQLALHKWEYRSTAQMIEKAATAEGIAVCLDEPKSESEPNPAPRPRPEPKSELKPEPKPEPKPESEPKPAPGPKPEPKPEQKPEPKPEPKSEPRPEPNPEASAKRALKTKPWWIAAAVLLICVLSFWCILRNVSKGQDVPCYSADQTDCSHAILTAKWQNETYLTIARQLESTIAVELKCPEQFMAQSGDGAYWSLSLCFDSEDSTFVLTGLVITSSAVSALKYEPRNVQYWCSDGQSSFDVPEHGENITISPRGDRYIFGLDLLSYPSLSWEKIKSATLMIRDDKGNRIADIEASWDSVAEADDTSSPKGAAAPALEDAWSSADKFFTVSGIDQAVFLDESGRTTRLLLRSLSSGEICADYRLEWDNGIIRTITRRDSSGNDVIKHEFSYADGVIESDAITADYPVICSDYNWVESKDCPDDVVITTDSLGRTVVPWPEKNMLRFINLDAEIQGEEWGESIKWTAKNAQGQVQYSSYFGFWIVDNVLNSTSILYMEFNEDGRMTDDYPFMAGFYPDEVYFDVNWNQLS